MSAKFGGKLCFISMKKSYEINMCSGPLFSQILLFAFPLMCSGVLQLLFNAADIIVVGRYAGSDAMAAVGATTSLIGLLVNFFIGISTGVNILVARFCGGEEFDEAQQTVQTSVLIALAGGLLLMLIGIGASRPLLQLMDTPADVLDAAVLYMRLYFLGMPATMVFNFGAAILRAIGDTRRPLYFLMCSGVINVCCNLFFVIVLKLGVAGVALATAIAQTISASLILFSLTHMDGVCHVDLKKLHFSRDKFFRLMQIGLPAGLQSVIFNISNVLVQSSVNTFGSKVIAGNTASANIEGFIYTSMNSLYQTNLSFTSQNLGARQYRRIDRILICCAASVLVVGFVLGNGAYQLGHQLVGLYSSNTEVIAYGVLRLGIIAAPYCLCGLMEVISGSVRGLGYSVLPMFVSLAGACFFRIFWIFTVFRWQHSLFVLYMSYPISWVLTITAHFISYFVVRHKVFRRGMPAKTEKAGQSV